MAMERPRFRRLDGGGRASWPRVPSWMRSPPGRWWLLGFFLLVVVVVLAFQGYVTHAIGPSAEPHDARGSTAPLAGTRPVLVARGDRLVSVQPPPGRRVALTFDDGPDPRWTPRVLDVLREQRVKATFFVVGSEAARHPGILRRIAAEGQQIGNHTFTHASLSNGPAWQRRLQLELTEATIAGITGRYARFVRPPYSATPDAVTPRQERDLARLTAGRYYVTLADYDSQDWQRPGVGAIVANATPPGRQGGIVMLHDGGGDRRQTVAALRVLIPKLRHRGFRFVPVSELAGVPAAMASPKASSWERLRGAAFQWSISVAFALTGVFTVLLWIIGALIVARALLLVMLARRHARQSPFAAVDEDEPHLAIVVPAYNEAVGIERTVRSLTSSDHPSFEVVVVDDGSTDETATIVASLDLADVRLVRQDNAGKAAALNTGIAMTDAPIVVMVDGDTLFEQDTLRRLVAPLADPKVGAVSGNTKVGNRRSLLGRWQHIEYVMGFNLDRRMYEMLQCTPTVPGAIGAFRREALIAVGGVPGDTLAEDTDLTLAIGRAGWRVVYAPEARAWTEAPATLGALWRQRYRWSFGTMQSVFKHRGAVLSREANDRRVGRLGLPYILLFLIVLPMMAPLIDLFAIYGMVFTDTLRTVGLWLAFNAVQLGVAAFAFRLDREPLRPLWALPLQQLLYRQLMYLVIIESTVAAIQGTRSGWRHLARTGDVVIEAQPEHVA
jgi:cellulose synthase/poly-beta-1,6-N-acetylglucosamine synthase-like glycosyltransferase/peptidoglycan/xylan/chitin deacetylase (PgdA/CDA1 family)